MAKYGEGDKRWIVEERPDGANVHNWHWAETDYLEWSRNLFSKHLSNLTVLDGEGDLYVKTKKVKKVEGEAYMNVRKGKIIPGYEISLALSWGGEAKDFEGTSLLKSEGLVDNNLTHVLPVVLVHIGQGFFFFFGFSIIIRTSNPDFFF